MLEPQHGTTKSLLWLRAPQTQLRHERRRGADTWSLRTARFTMTNTLGSVEGPFVRLVSSIIHTHTHTLNHQATHKHTHKHTHTHTHPPTHTHTHTQTHTHTLSTQAETLTT